MKATAIVLPAFALLTGSLASQSHTTIQGVLEQPSISWVADSTMHTLHFTRPVESIEARGSAEAADPFRYGIRQTVNVDFKDAAKWSYVADGTVIGRLAIQSTGASMMNVLFSVLALPSGAEVLVYDNEHRADLLYTSATPLRDDGKFQSALVPGDQIVIEFRGSIEQKNASIIWIDSYVHGHQDLFHDDGERGSGCLIDVACSLGDDWLDQKRSVVLFVKDDVGTHACTGVLLNNTSGSYVPYVQIANHCVAGNPANWVFYFNYETPGCSTGTAPLTQTVTGATFKASDYNGDFALYQLNSSPPASYNAFYAGWDRSGNVPGNGVVIGHPVLVDYPSLDGEKKITAWSNATSGTIGSFNKPGWIADITQGGLWGGSSGSPLFDANKRVVGQIWSGDTDCGPNRHLQAAKIKENWNGTAPNTRLKDWLDPGNTGANTLNGVYKDLRVKAKVILQGPYSGGTMLTGLVDGSYVPTTEPYTASGYTHVLTGGGETTSTGVLAASGNARIVDWVVIELRQATTPYSVIATRSALLRKDGTIAETDGSTNGVLFQGLPTAKVRVAIRHRNHLGIMTGSSYDLGSFTGTIDFSTTSTSLYGTDPTYVTGSVRCLWMADVTANSQLKYTGSGNDRDPILVRVGASTPNNVVFGYFPEDTTLDGAVKYTGSGNDRDPILTNLPGGGSNPNGVRNAQLP